MYEHAIRRIGPTATLLEWDDRIPSFDEVHTDALKAEIHPRSRSGDVMTLLEVQTRMACAIFAPLTSADRIMPGADAAYIKPNDRLTSAIASKSTAAPIGTAF
jgi:hypothetical protein